MLNKNQLKTVVRAFVSAENTAEQIRAEMAPHGVDRKMCDALIKEVTNELKIKIKDDYKLRYTWGSQLVDEKFAIIKRTDFIVIGAKRSSGKTTYSFDLAHKNARLGHKVLYISLEMEEMEIKEDFARKRAGITIKEELNYEIPEYKMDLYNKKLEELGSEKNLFFAGIRRGGNADWKGIMETINKYNELDLIIIDNLDLIEGIRGENDNERQKRIVKSILNLTSEYKIPLMMIHHYRKGNGSSSSDAMDELSGSGKIADGADRVLKITRNQDPDAVYPDKFKSRLYLQKARGYSEANADLYFIKGTFVDEPPSEDKYNGTYREQDTISNLLND